MKNKINKDKYLDYLDSCSSIRKSNLLNLKYSIDKEDDIKMKFTLIRSSIPILYSHYEGFLKECFLKLISLLVYLGGTKDIYRLIFSIITVLDENIQDQSAKVGRLLVLFGNVIKNDNYLYEIEMNKYKLGFKEIEKTFEILHMENPYKNTKLYHQLNELSNRYGIDPTEQIKRLYAIRCEIAHGNLTVSKRELYTLKPRRGITQEQVDRGYYEWCINYELVLKSIDVYKDIFALYLKFIDDYKAPLTKGSAGAM